MTKNDARSIIGISFLLACLGVILGIWRYNEGRVFEGSLYFVLVVVALSLSLMVLIAEKWYQERKGAFKLIVVALIILCLILFVLIFSQYGGNPELALVFGIVIGILIGLVTLVLILKRRRKQ